MRRKTKNLLLRRLTHANRTRGKGKNLWTGNKVQHRTRIKRGNEGYTLHKVDGDVVSYLKSLSNVFHVNKGWWEMSFVANRASIRLEIAMKGKAKM